MAIDNVTPTGLDCLEWALRHSRVVPGDAGFERKGSPVSRQDFEFTVLLEAAEVAQYLRSIAQGLENKQLNITCGEESYELNVPGHVEFRLLGRAREDEQRLRLQFTWHETPPAGLPELNIE